MTYLALAIGLLIFFAVIACGRVAQRTLTVGGELRASLWLMRSPELDDDEKEIRIRAMAGRMLSAFLVVAAWSLLAIAAPALAIWLGAKAGLYDIGDVMAAAGSWWFLIAATVLMTGLWWAGRTLARRRG